MNATRTAGPRRRQFVAAALGLGLVARPGAQAAYPDRALRIIVPQPPGGGFDFVSRVLAERLAKQLGQAVVVENRPGSGTLVGTDLAAKAAPDGYTLLTGSISNLALNMGLYRNLPYDSLRAISVWLYETARPIGSKSRRLSYGRLRYRPMLSARLLIEPVSSV